MPATLESLGIDKLSRDEQEALMESLQNHLAMPAEKSTISDALRAELRDRIREADEHPEYAVPCEEVHAAIRKRLGLK